MPRPVKETRLDTRSARTKLPPAAKPYWRALGAGMHLGYRKTAVGGAWVVRWGTNSSDYRTQTIGRADDIEGADGSSVLTYEQAADRARQVVEEVRRPAPAPEPPRRKAYTVRDAITDYLTWAEANTKSAKDAKLRAESSILPELGDIACADLTAKRIAEWRDNLALSGRRLRVAKGKDQRFAEAPKTKDEIRRRRSATNRVLTILKAALNRAFRHGEETGVETDKAWRTAEPFENVDAARVRYLTIDEAQRLLNACNKDFRDIVRAGLLTGARFGELAAVTVQDYNPDSQTLFIAESKAGKARHIVLTEEGGKFFDTIAAGRPREELLFRRTDGALWLKDYQVRPMKASCERAKIDPPISFHILRHTWASLSIMNGMPLMVVAKNLGHADTRMVVKHYGHLAKTYEVEMIRKHAPRFGEEMTHVKFTVAEQERPPTAQDRRTGPHADP